MAIGLIAGNINNYLGSIVLFAMFAVLLIGTIIFVAVIVWVYILHKDKLKIYRLSGSKTLTSRIYRIREVIDAKTGINKIKLANIALRKQIKIIPPNEPYTWYNEGRSRVLQVYEYEKGSFSYLKFKIDKKSMNEAKLEVIGQDMKAWYAMEMAETENKYTKLKWIEQYGPVLAAGFIMVALILSVIFLTNMVKDTLPAAANAAAEAAKMAQYIPPG